MPRARQSDPGYLTIRCPGCDDFHTVTVAPSPNPWGWDGSLELPTITPSIKVSCNWGDPPVRRVCHSFVKVGRIEFLSDCTHALVGQTVDLPDLKA